MKHEGRRAFSGFFGKRIADCRWILLWSAVLALLCTFISYPGIWYSDSYVRVTTGQAALNAVIKTLTGHRFRLDTGNAFTIVPSFLMAFSQGLTGHVGLYTFLQAFAFFAAVFLLIREMSPAFRKTRYLLFGLSPLIYGMSVYYEAGIGCVSGLICLMLLFSRTGEEKPRGDRLIELGLVAFASFITFGYRTNALTVAPVLVYVLMRAGREKVRKALILGALILGLLATSLLPRIFDIHSLSTASAGIVWETLTVIQRMEPEEREAYLDYLDDIGGEGSTRAALATSTEDTAGNFMWSPELGIGSMSAPGATGTAIRKYVGLLMEKTGLWLGVKWDVIRKSLGIGYTLDYSEYNYNRWDRMAEYGFNDSPQRQAFYDSFMWAVSFFGFYTLHPWVSFTLCLLMLVIERIRGAKLYRRHILVFWLAAFYYLAYLLDTPAYDFRYFYPSLVLLTGAQAGVAAGWISEICQRRRKRL